MLPPEPSHSRLPSALNWRAEEELETQWFGDLPKVKVRDTAGTLPQAGLTPLASLPWSQVPAVPACQIAMGTGSRRNQRKSSLGAETAGPKPKPHWPGHKGEDHRLEDFEEWAKLPGTIAVILAPVGPVPPPWTGKSFIPIGPAERV